MDTPRSYLLASEIVGSVTTPLGSSSSLKTDKIIK